MKVRELIEELQKLDQERNIWVNYDNCYNLIPQIEEADNEWNTKSGVKENDYMIIAY